MTKPLDGNKAGVTDTECEDTLELELSAEQMLALSRADTLIQSSPVPVTSIENLLLNVPKDERRVRTAVVLGLSAAVVSLGSIAYLATSRAQPVPVRANTVARSAALETPALPSANNAPVRFTNPFDATEVFEFPPGTSKSEARHAVADLLLKRARDRQNSFQNNALTKCNSGSRQPCHDHKAHPTQLRARDEA